MSTITTPETIPIITNRYGDLSYSLSGYGHKTSMSQSASLVWEEPDGTPRASSNIHDIKFDNEVTKTFYCNGVAFVTALMRHKIFHNIPEVILNGEGYPESTNTETIETCDCYCSTIIILGYDLKNSVVAYLEADLYSVTNFSANVDTDQTGLSAQIKVWHKGTTTVIDSYTHTTPGALMGRLNDHLNCGYATEIQLWFWIESVWTHVSSYWTMNAVAGNYSSFLQEQSFGSAPGVFLSSPVDLDPGSVGHQPADGILEDCFYYINCTWGEAVEPIVTIDLLDQFRLTNCFPFHGGIEYGQTGGHDDNLLCGSATAANKPYLGKLTGMCGQFYTRKMPDNSNRFYFTDPRTVSGPEYNLNRFIAADLYFDFPEEDSADRDAMLAASGLSDPEFITPLVR